MFSGQLECSFDISVWFHFLDVENYNKSPEQKSKPIHFPECFFSKLHQGVHIAILKTKLQTLGSRSGNCTLFFLNYPPHQKVLLIL